MKQHFKKWRTKRAATKWSNKINKELGNGYPHLRTLPKGKSNKARLCPLALATGLFITPTKAFKNAENHSLFHETYLLPLKVRQFVAGFDNGEYPELVR